MVCFYDADTNLCDITCHVFRLLRKACERTCGNMLKRKVQYVYTPTASLGTAGDVSIPFSS